MVTSSELCTIATTDDKKEKNLFLVWGARPVVKSPLAEILEQGSPKGEDPAMNSKSMAASHTLVKCGSSDTMENTVFTEGSDSGPNTPQRRSSNLVRSSHSSVPCLSPSSSDLGASYQNMSAPQPQSNEDTPSKTSSNDSIAKSPPKGVSSEAISKAPPGMITGQGRNPSLNFIDVPHTMTPCSSSPQYLNTLTKLLFESLDASRGKVLKREGGSSTQLPASHHHPRRGSSLSSFNIQGMSSEGVITRPTPLDLVGKSGILSLLSVEGIKEADLEGLSCYGSNVLVLIQAQVEERAAEEGEEGKGREGVTSDTPTFRIGRKLTHRGRYVGLNEC